jgi:DNA-binding transcriptional LysR family regulator
MSNKPKVLHQSRALIARINDNHGDQLPSVLGVDIAVLKLFTDVVKHSSFATVARDRDVDPSSVSRAIAGLETELGIRLFQRTTRKLALTEAGAAYFARIEPLLEELQQAGEFASEIAGEPKGTLRVTASVSFGLKCIVPLLPKFEAQYPELTLDLLLTDQVVDLFTERIDVAIRLGVLADSSLIAQRLMLTHYWVCASPSYVQQYGQPRSPQELSQHQCLLFPLTGFRSQWRFCDRQNQETEVAIHGRTIISNALALQQCAIAGMGIALLPNWLIQVEIDRGDLVNLFPQHQVTATDFNTAAWIVYPSRSYVPLKVRAFSDFLKQHY